VADPPRLVELAPLTHTGRVRPHNEDRFLADPPLLVVADGMGGAQAGEVAATVAVEAVAGLGADTSVGRLRQAVEEANRSIREMAAADPDRSGMGTTVTAALLENGRLELVHVGDSRAYLLRDGALRRLTDDHSIVGELVRRGLLTEEEADAHPQRNVITRALGAEPEVQVDELVYELRSGDVILLCTDGLYAEVGEAAIARIIAGAPTLAEAADALVEAANQAGGSDNITVVLARFAGQEAEDVAEAEAAGPADESGTTARFQIDGAGGGGTAPTVTLTGHPEGGVEAPGKQAGVRPRLLERVPRRRSRRTPILIGVVVVLAAAAATATYIGSRTYFVDAAPDGSVAVFHGLPVSVLGVDLFSRWQDTGVPASLVRKSSPGTLGRSTDGQGEAVATAVRLVWKDGLPAVPRLVAAPAHGSASAP
jgi:serine/threonine protein phosphatase PrpC